MPRPWISGYGSRAVNRHCRLTSVPAPSCWCAQAVPTAINVMSGKNYEQEFDIEMKRVQVRAQPRGVGAGPRGQEPGAHAAALRAGPAGATRATLPGCCKAAMGVGLWRGLRHDISPQSLLTSPLRRERTRRHGRARPPQLPTEATPQLRCLPVHAQEGKSKSTPWGCGYRAPPAILHGYTSKVTGKTGERATRATELLSAKAYTTYTHPQRLHYCLGTASGPPAAFPSCAVPCPPRRLRGSQTFLPACCCMPLFRPHSAEERLDLRSAAKSDKFCK